MKSFHKYHEIKIIAFMLVISTIITLPGFMVGVSAVKRSIPDKATRLNDIEDIDSVTDLHFETPEGDGIIPSSYFDLELYRDQISELQSSSQSGRINIGANRTNQGAGTYFRQYKYNNDTLYGNVDLSTGELNTSFDLAYLKGNNGIDLKLSIRYTTDESKDGDYTFSNINGTPVYYVRLYDGIYVSNTYEFVYKKYSYLTFETYTEFITYLSNHESNTYVSGAYTYVFGSIEETGQGYLPVVNFTAREENVKRNGLGYGWVFNIPNIETIGYLNLTRDTYDEYKVLTLDNGNKYNIKNDQFTYLRTGDITYQTVNTIVNNQTAKYLVTLLDGTKYYFDIDGLCIKKADRYGNSISYTYVTNNGVTYISSISDDYGRSIDLTYNSNNITVTSDDTVVAVINLGTEYSEDPNGISREVVSSITYNSIETYSFDYELEEISVELGPNMSDYETYVLLTEVTHPNGDKNEYTYETVETPWGESGTKEIPMVCESSDVINNTTCNVITYTRTGNSYESYFQRLNGSGAYNYTVTVGKSSGNRVYTFNVSDLLVSDSYGYQIKEYVYTNNLPTSITVKDYGSSSNGSYVTSTESYTYDNKGNVLTYTDPQSVTSTYTYDSAYNIKTSETRLGETKRYILSNDSKSITEYRLEKNNTVYDRETYTYDSKGNILTKTKYTYPGGTDYVTTVYGYTDNVTRPNNMSLTGLYNTTVSVSGTLYTLELEYDISGRIISSTDANGNITENTYDNLGRLTRTDYEDGTYETYTYSVLENSLTYRNRNGYVTKTYYDIYDNELSVYEISGNTQTLLKSNLYDTNYRLIRETDALGNYTEYTYDLRSRVTHIRTKDSNGTLKYTETYSYLVSSGKLKNIKTVIGNNTYSPNVVSIEYINNLGQKVKEGGRKGSEEILSEYTYDNKGNITQVKDAKGNITTYTYDIYGNVLSVTDPLNHTITSTYNSLGEVLSTTDANGNTSTFEYDEFGRKVLQITPVDGSTYKQTSTYEYDLNGNITETKVTDNAPGSSTTYIRTVNTYDSNNNVISTKMYNGNSVETEIYYTYNPYGKVLTETIGNTVVQSNVYSIRGELLSTSDALNHSETYTYNIKGQITSKTDRNGTVFSYTYDTLGNVVTETAQRTGYTTQSVTYTYTPTNQVRSINNGTVIINKEYDSFGRIISESEYDGIDTYVLEFEYDSNGNRTHLTETLNEDVVKEEYYIYNANNQLTSVGNYDFVEHIIEEPIYDDYDEYAIIDVQGNTLFTYDYTYTLGSYGIGVYNSNNVQITTVYLTPTDALYYGSIQGSLQQDANGEYVSGTISFSSGNTTRTYYFYDFENDNQGEAIESGVPIGYYITDGDGCRAFTVFVDNDGLSDDYYCWITSEIYNPEMRMIYSRRGGNTRDTELVWEAVGAYVTYTYDSNGNLASASYNNGTSTEYTYTEGNLVKSVTNKRGNTVLSSYVYTYYLSGNVKTITENGTTLKSYVYDRLGRLTSETITEGNDTDSYVYEYDSKGNRTKLTHNGIYI